MVTNDQSFEVELTPQSINTIEKFVDTVCDQLFINETYYGNILMAMTEMFGLIGEKATTGHVVITYKTDYQKITINLQPIDTELINSLKRDLKIDDITDDLNNQTLFLIRSLVDEFEYSGEDSISLIFDISALHNKIYLQRQNLLQSYFSETQKDKVKKSDDKL